MSASSRLPHRRYNPLNGDWVLVSPHRTQRPWQGQVEPGLPETRPAYDPDCYLCPENSRVGGVRNPDYTSTFVFDNDFQALLPESEVGGPEMSELFRKEPARGRCRVVCFSPRHDLTLARMSPEEIRQVIATWALEASTLGSEFGWVQIFENRGAMMGASNPHPHGQIWATHHLPDQPAREDRHQRAYFEAHGRPLLLDYAEEEAGRGERIVYQNDEWLAVVPYWAVWPFETLLLPRRSLKRIEDLSSAQQLTLADALKGLLTRYDNLFETSFPYSMGWHPAPYTPAAPADHWQLHAHFYPPLLRSATVRKFMVGYEMLGEPQRDLTPEQAAQRLRDLNGIHYLEQSR